MSEEKATEMLVRAAEMQTFPSESVKSKMLDEENYGRCNSYGDDTGSMRWVDQIGKIMGLSEEVVLSVKKDHSVQQQLMNCLQSMQKDSVLLPGDAKILADSSPINETFGVDGDLSPNYALGSCALPRSNLTSPDYAISSMHESFLCDEEVVPIAVPGLYRPPEEQAHMEEEISGGTWSVDTIERETTLNMIFSHDDLESSSDDEDSCSMDRESDYNLRMHGCEFINENDAENPDLLSFCNQMTSPEYILKVNGQSENDIQFERSPISGPTFNEISENAEYAVSFYGPDVLSNDDPFSHQVSPDLPNDQQVSPMSNASVNNWRSSSPAIEKEAEDAGSAELSEDLCTVFLDDLFHVFDNQSTHMGVDHSPVYNPGPSSLHDQSVEVSDQSLKSLPLSPHSTVSDSSHGSDIDAALLDFVVADCDAVTLCKDDSDADDISPCRKRRKVDNQNLTVLPELSYDVEECPVNNNWDYFSTGSVDDLDESNPVLKRDGDGDTLLHIAVANENLEAVKLSLELMAEVDAVNRNLQTPLHIACYVENYAMMEILLRRGANPLQPDADGNNMMHIGCMNGSTQIMELLGTHFETMPHTLSAMLGAHNYEGNCPLHELVKMRCGNVLQDAKQKSKVIIEHLIQNFDCNLDEKDLKSGQTVLMMAIQGQDWELVDVLLACGADVNVSSHAELFALDYVAYTENLKLAENLISRGALSGSKNDFTSSAMKTLFDNDKRRRRRQGRKRSKTQRKD